MFGKIKRTAVSFFAVMALFWVYRLLADPFIEPAQKEKRVVATAPEEHEPPPEHVDRLGGYSRFFPAGAWERDNPIMLESETAKLLMKEYTNLPDGRVLLKPCTVIFLPDGEAAAADSHHRVIIMQAPEATMHFDGPLDLGRGKVSRLLDGVLSGEITIQSGPTRPEGGDDLYAVTRDVQLVDGRLVSSHDVQFRFGASQGHGQGMQIDLIPAAGGDKSRTFNYSGVRDLQLLRDVEMHLQRTRTTSAPAGKQAGPQSGSQRHGNLGANPALGGGNAPVEVRCRGPFDFDMVANIATFRKQVDVLRPNPNGPPDQISCEVLSVFFAPREPDPKAAATAPKPQRKPVGGMQALEARKLEARGNPVVVRTPSSGGEVRGERLLYDVVTGNMVMESQTGGVQIESTQLRGQVSRLEASFHEETPNTQAAGTPAAPGSGTNPETAHDGANGNNNAGGKNGAIGNNNRSRQGNDANNGPQQHYEISSGLLQAAFITRDGASKLEQVNAEGNVWFAQSPVVAGEPRPLEIRGDHLQVLHADTQAQVTVTGQPAQIIAQGMTMFGQAVHTDQASNRMWIDGAGRMVIEQAAPPPGAQPAASTENSLGLWSGNGPTVVDWQGSMKFDGQVARFERNVIGTQGTQSLHTEILDATLQNRIDFSAGRPQDRPALELASCPGEALLENHEFKDGNPTVVDWMQVRDLKVNRTSGDMSAPGPGRMRSWRLGPPPSQSMIPGDPTTAQAARPRQNSPPAASTFATAAVAPSADGTTSRDQINFVDVQYQNGLTGNALRREFTFHDQVRSISGPVAAWNGQLDGDNPAPGTMLLTCNQLTLYEVGPRVEGRSPLNLKAEGNAEVEGQRLEGDLFRAWASELDYAQEKDLILLKGDGRSDAKLFRQVKANAPLSKTIARTIMYWPSTRRVEVNDVHYLDFSQFGQPTAPAKRK